MQRDAALTLLTNGIVFLQTLRSHRVFARRSDGVVNLKTFEEAITFVMARSVWASVKTTLLQFLFWGH